MAQRAEVVLADLVFHCAVFAHAAHPELVLLDGQPRHDAHGQFPLGTKSYNKEQAQEPEVRKSEFLEKFLDDGDANLLTIKQDSNLNISKQKNWKWERLKFKNSSFRLLKDFYDLIRWFSDVLIPRFNSKVYWKHTHATRCDILDHMT